MRRTRTRSSLIAILAAVAFCAIETIALAHEIEHDLQQHDEPSCPLHLYVTSFAKTVGTDFGFDLATTPDSYDIVPAAVGPRVARRLGYHGRAPPHAVANIG